MMGHNRSISTRSEIQQINSDGRELAEMNPFNLCESDRRKSVSGNNSGNKESSSITPASGQASGFFNTFENDSISSV